MVEIQSLSKAYGSNRVLNALSFTIKKGEVVGLFGPNGAGKSTLLNILALIARPDSGQYFFDETDALKRSPLVKPRIGYVPQDIALFEELTVWDNLLCWSRQPGKVAKARAEALAESLCLQDLRKSKIRSLSGGMKRRVNLAVGLLNDPDLLILDEPLAGVDTEHTAIIAGHLRYLAESGVTQIISGHSLYQLEPLVDSALVLKQGALIYQGDKEGAQRFL